jgi:hypothetical protein
VVGQEYDLIGNGLGNLICPNVARGDTYLLRIGGISNTVPADTLLLSFYFNDVSLFQQYAPPSGNNGTWVIEIWCTFCTGPPATPPQYLKNSQRVTYIQDGVLPKVNLGSRGGLAYFGTDVVLNVTVATITGQVRMGYEATEAVLTKLY